MRISRLILLLSLFACTPKTSEKAETTPPNILLILVDDLGKEWISAYGAQDISTPNIDALAASGMMFHNAWSMPQCTPTRLTLLTGQYPFRHGWVNHWDVPRWGGGAHYDENLNPSLGKAMKAAGYTSCIAGKWQIDDFRVEPDALSRNGFDDWCMWTGYEAGVPASAERFQNPYVFTKEGSQTYEADFGPDIFRDFIIDFIKENKEDPMFIYFPMVLTHPPLVNTPDETADTKIGKHQAMVRYTDKITGQLVQTLKDEGILDQTLIIFTTDNGTSRGLHGNYKNRIVEGGKAQTIEAGINSPFIASWPAVIPPASQSTALIDMTDFYPTFLDLAGIDPKGYFELYEEGQVIDGQSFKECLSNPGFIDNRSWILSMGGGNNARLTDKGVENQFLYRDRVLRDQRFKLRINSQQEPEAFYDLLNDPFEEKNILDSMPSSEAKASFDALLTVAASFPDQDADPKYTPNPPQDWDVQITAESHSWKLK